MSSGNLTDLVGSNDLTAGSAPNYDYDNALRRQTVGEDDGSAGRFTAATSSVFNSAATSIAILLVARFTATGGGNRGVFGKRDNAGDAAGYYLRYNASNNLIMILDGGASGSDVETVAQDFGDGRPHVILFLVDYNANNAQVITDLGSSTGGAISSASMTNTSSFELLKGYVESSAPVNIAMMAVFEGAAAEGMGLADVMSLKMRLKI